MNDQSQIKNVLWYLISFGFKNVIPLLLLSIFTKYLTIEDYGIYALSLLYGVFCSGIINMGLTNIFERNYFELNELDRGDILFTILIFTLLNLLVFVSVTFFLSDKIAAILFRQHQVHEILVETLIFQSFKSFNQYFLIRFKNDQNAKKYTLFSFLDIVISSSLSLYFVLIHSLGLYGYVLGQALGQIIVYLSAFGGLFYPFKNRLNVFELIKFLKLAIPLTPRIFFGVINTQFDKYMLGILGAIGGVGIFDIGQKLANTTFTFMTALQNVYSPQVYKRLFSNDINLRNNVGSYLIPFFYFSILICLIVGVFSYEILYLLTPDEFHQAASIVSILSLLYGFYFFGKQPQILFAKKTALISLISLITIVLNIGLNLLLINHYGTTGAAIATTTAGILSTTITFYYGQKYTPIQYGKIVFFVLLYFVFSILITLYFMNIDFNYKLLLAFKLVILIIFLIIGWMSEIFNFNMLKQILRLKSIN